MNISKPGKLNSIEVQKSIRDVLIIALGTSIPQIIEILQNVDYGEYTNIMSVILPMVLVFVNRIFNIKRY